MLLDGSWGCIVLVDKTYCDSYIRIWNEGGDFDGACGKGFFIDMLSFANDITLSNIFILFFKF